LAAQVSPPMPPAASPWPYPQSSFLPPAQFSSPGAPSDDRPSPFVSLSSIDNQGGLFSRDPSIPYGLFPYPFDTSPGPTSRFESGPVSAGGLDAPAAMPATPGLFPAPGWPPAESFLPPFPPLPNPFAAVSPAPDNSSGLSPGPPGSATPPTAPPRSILFNQPQPNWDLGSALIARQRDAAALDAGAQDLGAGDLPRSKSGGPVTSSPPQQTITPQQWLDVAHGLSPNIVDYLTKTLPPAPPFPSTPGKIPSSDNPYGPGAVSELASWIPAVLERIAAVPIVRVAGIAENAATDTALQAAKAAADRASTPSTLERLQAHVNNAYALLEQEGLTAAQKKSLEYYPYLEAAHRGERIDTFAKRSIAEDKYLTHLKITPRFQFGPDIYDPINNLWYDITTLQQWPLHEVKYAERFGRGAPLFYGDK
jgi:hypothetical protein